MRTLLVFFLFLFLPLFGGSNFARATTYSNVNFSTTSNLKKNQQAETENYTIVKNNAAEEEEIDLVSVEDEYP